MSRSRSPSSSSRSRSRSPSPHPPLSPASSSSSPSALSPKKINTRTGECVFSPKKDNENNKEKELDSSLLERKHDHHNSFSKLLTDKRDDHHEHSSKRKTMDISLKTNSSLNRDKMEHDSKEKERESVDLRKRKFFHTPSSQYYHGEHYRKNGYHPIHHSTHSSRKSDQDYGNSNFRMTMNSSDNHHHQSHPNRNNDDYWNRGRGDGIRQSSTIHSYSLRQDDKKMVDLRQNYDKNKSRQEKDDNFIIKLSQNNDLRIVERRELSYEEGHKSSQRYSLRDERRKNISEEEMEDNGATITKITKSEIEKTFLCHEFHPASLPGTTTVHGSVIKGGGELDSSGFSSFSIHYQKMSIQI